MSLDTSSDVLIVAGADERCAVVRSAVQSSARFNADDVAVPVATRSDGQTVLVHRVRPGESGTSGCAAFLVRLSGAAKQHGCDDRGTEACHELGPGLFGHAGCTNAVSVHLPDPFRRLSILRSPPHVYADRWLLRVNPIRMSTVDARRSAFGLRTVAALGRHPQNTRKPRSTPVTNASIQSVSDLLCESVPSKVGNRARPDPRARPSR